MPLISAIERKSVKGRLLIGASYLVLIVGALTMIYPFMLMLRLSTADTSDNESLDILPAFWTSQDSLAKKYLLKRYAGNNQNPYAPEVDPDFAPMPVKGPEWTVANYATLPKFWETYFGFFNKESREGQNRQIRDYREFLTTLPPTDYITVDWDSDPEFRSFKQFLEQDLKLRKADRDVLYLVRPDASIRDWHPHRDASYQSSLRYKAALKPQFRRPLYPGWVSFLKAKYGQFDVTKLNANYHTRYTSWSEIRFPLTEPSNQRMRSDYREFVSNAFPDIWTRILGDHQSEWQKFLREDQKLRSPLDWKRLTGLNVDAISAIRFSRELPDNEGWAAVWSRFVHSKIEVHDRELLSPDRLYIFFLRDRYGSVQALDAAWNTQYTSWADLNFGESLTDYRALVDNSLSIKIALSLNPYHVALGYLASESTAILNTLLLMVLALVAALTVNPLAAYALSRFRIPGSHKILLFILATMALPAEIAMVPSFLLVKNLGLMDNYLAIILPGAASAFGIFLLKGFFDSLPSELYEAATLDGAPELIIFARITIPLATPILAVTAMGAALGAYGTFVPAILYLQNQDLWPIMPRLFSMSTQHDVEITYGVNMAALVIGSIPTFLVFLVAQRQIMRGIILPTFK